VTGQADMTMEIEEVECVDNTKIDVVVAEQDTG
jgi:hypothetical protein